jgi:CRP-like cAMP-binding protein
MPAHDPRENHVLDALLPEERERLFPHLAFLEMPLGMVLYDSGEELHHIYFPTDSIVSLSYAMKNGASSEMAVVGNEGVVGVALFMGGVPTPSRATVQSGGVAYRLAGKQLKAEVDRHGTLWDVLLRYTQSLLTQIIQTAACNRHHSIEQQLCRHLLTTIDRLRSDKLTMTQDLIATTLGVRREGVTVAAGRLQDLGVISYRRGQITVLNRRKLKKLSCECYAVLKKETERLQSPR